MFFSVLTKNSNQDILTKNLVTFKKQDGVKDESFNIFRLYQKIWFLGDGLRKKQYVGGIA